MSVAQPLSATPVATSPEPLVRVENLCKYFPVAKDLLGRARAWKKAVDGVGFAVAPGRTYALVGESGCGKTTTGRCVLRLLEPTSGRIIFRGTDIAAFDKKTLARQRRKMQMIFQDPYSSLNSRLTAGAIVSEGWDIHGLVPRAERADRLAELFRAVGLLPEHMARYPHEFSGGQRQRLGIARALALSPDFIVCDEAVSALDVSIQAQIINLLIGLQEERGLAYLFISHDLAVVRHISHRVGVMYAGKLLEEADTDELFANPRHPYTQMLLSAIPAVDPAARRRRLAAVSEAAPDPVGCPFAGRCPLAEDACRVGEIPARPCGNGHWVKCISKRIDD